MVNSAMTFDPDYGAPAPAPRPWWRRAVDRVGGWFRFGGRSMASGLRPRRPRGIWGWVWRVVVVLLLLYFPLGALIVENIDDDSQFKTQGSTPGESRAVAIAAALVTREVDIHS